jgi:hypothetical protein
LLEKFGPHLLEQELVSLARQEMHGVLYAIPLL